MPLIYAFILFCLLIIGSEAAMPSTKKTIVKLGMYSNIKNSYGTADLNAAQSLAAFLMAVDEINNDPKVLPTVRLNVVLGAGLGSFGGVTAVQHFLDANFTIDRDGQHLPATSFVNNNPVGVDFVVGAGDNHETESSNMVLDNFAITQLHTVAQSTEFSLGRVHFSNAYKVQNVPVDSFVAKAWQEVACNHFRWSKLVVFATTDVDGVKSGIELHDNTYCTIDEMSLQSVNIGTTDFSVLIKHVKPLGALIFAVFCPPHEAGLLLEQMYDSGLLVEGTQVIGNANLMHPDVIKAFKNPPNPPASRVKAIMRGVLALQFAPKYPLKGSAGGRKFIRSFSSLPNTVTISGATTTCSSAKDDTNNYLYRFTGYNGRSMCAGLDFSQYRGAGAGADNGTSMYAYAPYAYDAVYSYAQGIQRVLDAHGQNKNALTGGNVYKMLVGNVTVSEGATGFSRYFAGKPEFQYSGAGDREEGLYYSMHNFQPQAYDADVTSGGVVQVGLWSREGGFVPCTTSNHQQLLVEGSTTCATQILYRTKDNQQPLDTPPDLLLVMDPGLAAALEALGVVLCVVVVLSIAVVVTYRSSKVMKASQPIMVVIIMFGCLLGGLRVVAGGVTLSDGTCVAWFWLGHLSFTIVFAAMAAKLWRVDKVVNTKSLKRIKISEMRVVVVSAAVILAVGVYLMISTVVGVPHLSHHTSNFHNQTTQDSFCNLTYAQFETTLFVLEGFALLYGVFLCYKTKDVPDAINEAKSVTSAIVLLLSVCAVTFPVVFLVELSTQVHQFIQAIAFALASFGVIYIVYFPKIFLVLSGRDVDIKTGSKVSGGASFRQKLGDSFKGSGKRGDANANANANANADAGADVNCGRDGATGNNSSVHSLAEIVKFEKKACIAPVALVGKATYGEQAELCNNQIAVWTQLLVCADDLFNSKSTNSKNNESSISKNNESSINFQRDSTAPDGSVTYAVVSEAGDGNKTPVRQLSETGDQAVL